jgi:hypothetical protein
MMKTEICAGNFSEIPMHEQLETNGGGLHFLILAGAAAVTQIILDWDNFKNGLMGRPENS